MRHDTERLFHEIAGLSAAERESYFERNQIGTELRAEMDALLGFDGQPGALTSRVATEAQRLLSLGVGETCGPYRLESLLGRGGMGSVYLARRTDGEVEQRVAVKVLHRSAEDSQFRDRFLRERQILASLNHPGIAHLLDAGHTPQGQPYLVMDYVDGIPIDVYSEKLDLRERLNLLLGVCDAVSHAHKNLIIHRDLKPSNILVDSTGRPKLLDFGIAKILDEAADQTQTREMMLTPDYASPEQVTRGVQSTAADVYSLGAVLYKLLTGRSPHDFSRGDSLESVICLTQPVPPSRLVSSLPADLDFITAKALRKEPEDRYSSADALADDIRAFLELRPVRARSGNAWYLARKFLRRYWIPVTAATLAIAGLGAGVVVASRERAVAQRRFLEVRKLAGRFFALDSEIRSVPGTTKARHSIVTTSMQYLEALSAEVHGDQELAIEVGSGYLTMAEVLGVPITSNLGDRAGAGRALEKAEALVAPVIAASPANRKALLAGAQIARSRMILAETDHHNEEALVHARDVLSRLAALENLQPDSEEKALMVRIYSNCAQTHMNVHLLDDAVRIASKGAELARTFKSSTPSLSSVLSVKANSLRMLGDLDAALKAIQEARKDAESAPAAIGRSYLYAVYWREGMILGEDGGVSLNRPAEALAAFQRSADLVESMAAKDPNDVDSRIRLASATLEIGKILRHSDPARALAVYDHAIARFREVPANLKIHRENVRLLAGSSYAARKLGQTADAARRAEEAERILRQIGDLPASKVTPGSEGAAVLQALADHAAATGRTEAAIQGYQELISKVMASSPNWENDLRNATAVVQLYQALAELQGRAGRQAEAKALRQRQGEIWQHWDRKLPGNAFVRRQIDSL